MRLGLDFLWVDVFGEGRSFRLEVMEYSMGTWRSRDDSLGQTSLVFFYLGSKDG